MLDRRRALLAAIAAGVAGRAAAQVPSGPRPIDDLDRAETIELWPAGAPGAPAHLPIERVLERSSDPPVHDRARIGIARPRMVVFRPAMPNGSAALILPGGGYQRVVIDKEGFETARWLAERGWTAFVLFYRLPGEGWRDAADVPLADAQRAVRIIRQSAAAYGVQADRIAAIGFSAGGHACGELASRFAAAVYRPIDAADRLSARPDAAGLIYAVQSMVPPLAHAGSRALLIGASATRETETAHTPAYAVAATTPPCFLVHAEDDPAVDVANTLMMRAALKAAGVPVETHLFEHGGHGFGLRGAAGKPVQAWPELFARWARSHGLG